MGDLILIGDVKGRLQQCFTHDYRKRKYVFLVVDLVRRVYKDLTEGIVHREELMDPVLDLPVYE